MLSGERAGMGFARVALSNQTQAALRGYNVRSAKGCVLGSRAEVARSWLGGPRLGLMSLCNVHAQSYIQTMPSFLKLYPTPFCPRPHIRLNF